MRREQGASVSRLGPILQVPKKNNRSSAVVRPRHFWAASTLSSSDFEVIRLCQSTFRSHDVVGENRVIKWSNCAHSAKITKLCRSVYHGVSLQNSMGGKIEIAQGVYNLH